MLLYFGIFLFFHKLLNKSSNMAKPRAMTNKTQNDIEAMIGVPIIVNEDVDQPLMRDYSAGFRSKWKENDDESQIEWISYPWFDDKENEWRCVGQFADEKGMLYLRPFILMSIFPFYRGAILEITENNTIARKFMLEWITNLGPNNYKFGEPMQIKDEQQSYFEMYLKKLMEIRFRFGIKRDSINGYHKSNLLLHGVFIPSNIYDDMIAKYCDRNKFVIQQQGHWDHIYLPRDYIKNNYFPDGILKQYADGGQTRIVFDDDNKLKLSYNKKKNVLMLKEIKYLNLNKFQVQIYNEGGIKK